MKASLRDPESLKEAFTDSEHPQQMQAPSAPFGPIGVTQQGYLPTGPVIRRRSLSRLTKQPRTKSHAAA